MKRRIILAVSAVVAATLAFAGCGYGQGPAGTVVGKSKHLACHLIGGHQQCAWKYRLTTRDKAGVEHTFRVTRSDYKACYMRSAYPQCTKAR